VLLLPAWVCACRHLYRLSRLCGTYSGDLRRDRQINLLTDHAAYKYLWQQLASVLGVHVCLLARIFNEPHVQISLNFCAYCFWLWIGRPLAAMQYARLPFFLWITSCFSTISRVAARHYRSSLPCCVVVVSSCFRRQDWTSPSCKRSGGRVRDTSLPCFLCVFSFVCVLFDNSSLL